MATLYGNEHNKYFYAVIIIFKSIFKIAHGLINELISTVKNHGNAYYRLFQISFEFLEF